MIRKPDWEQRLNNYLESVADKPHKYGSHDCMLFVANVIKAQTGKDLGRGHRRKYSSKIRAVKYLRKIGFDSTEAMLDSLLEEKPIGFAQRGDIVLTPDDIPGVCYGSDALVVGMIEGEETEGLRRIPRALWTKAWAV